MAKFTPARKAKFISSLMADPNVSAAAQAAGITRAGAYKARIVPEKAKAAKKKEIQQFADAWDEAIEISTDALESEVRRRAMFGTQETIYHQGTKCGDIIRHHDTLAIFLLKARRPELYRERASVDHKVTAEIDGLQTTLSFFEKVFAKRS